MDSYDMPDTVSADEQPDSLPASQPQVRSYLASLADAFGLPRELVHAVAQTESEFDTAKVGVKTLRPSGDSARQFDPDNKGYGLMQVSDAQIGRTVAAPDGSPFRIGDDVRDDWKANARAGVALLAQQHQLAEIEQPNASPEEHAQQAYSGYSAGAAMRDRYLFTLPDDSPAHSDDRAFLQNYRNLSSFSGDQAKPQSANSQAQTPSRPQGEMQSQPQSPSQSQGTSAPADFEPTSGSIQLQRVFPERQRPVPVSAGANGADVALTYEDGRQEIRAGGARSWRNNNPGNIRPGAFARSQGAIGDAGGFAVFPDEQMGQEALTALLRTREYQNLTLSAALARYAPPNENDTAAYHRFVQNATGLNGAARMSTLNDRQLDSITNAIRRIEGWTPGALTYRLQE